LRIDALGAKCYLVRYTMSGERNGFQFTGAIFREGRHYASLCLEVDVASQGATRREAKKMLAAAVTLYLESCFEDGMPYLRPVPKEEDPRVHPPENLVEVFPLKVSFRIHAFA